LYSKEKKDDAAIEKLINKKEFKWAEEYCAEGSD
jgi:hypothetical protein